MRRVFIITNNKFLNFASLRKAVEYARKNGISEISVISQSEDIIVTPPWPSQSCPHCHDLLALVSSPFDPLAFSCAMCDKDVSFQNF